MPFILQNISNSSNFQLLNLGSGGGFSIANLASIGTKGSLDFNTNNAIEVFSTGSFNVGAFDFNSSSFAMQFWIYPEIGGDSYGKLFSLASPGSYGTSDKLSLTLESSGYLTLNVNGNTSNTTSSILNRGYNQWYYITLAKDNIVNGQAVTVAIDGQWNGACQYSRTTVQGPITFTLETSSLGIGNSEPPLPSSYGYKGKITNFEIIKGYNPFTGSFVTIPTSQLTPNVSSSLLLLAITGSPSVFWSDSSGKNRTVNNDGNVAFSALTPYS